MDAAQGIEAQTLANAYLAIENDLEIVPVVNKIDLPQADPDGAAARAGRAASAATPTDVLRISAKTGAGRRGRARRDRRADPGARGRAARRRRARSIFDSSYDQYRGVVAFVRVVDGTFSTARAAARHGARAPSSRREELGFMSPPERADRRRSSAGEVGYVITGLKDVSRAPGRRHAHLAARAGGRAAAGLQGRQADGVRRALPDRLGRLPRAARRARAAEAERRGRSSYEPETSQALGFGFRCGFLGLLHMEIVRERLEREFDLDLLITAPNVAYRVTTRTRRARSRCTTRPRCRASSSEVEEPYIKASVIVPKEYVGAVMELCNERRGRFDHMEYLSEGRVLLLYELPLGEIVLDFYDQLKSRTRGYASFDYDLAGFRAGELVRVDMLVAGEPVDALSLIIHRDFAYDRGRAARRAAARGDPAPDVRRPRAGGDRLAGHRARDDQGASARTCSPSATAATSRASASCSRSRRRARSG